MTVALSKRKAVRSLLVIIFVMMNSVDILYMSAYKFGFSVVGSYATLFSISFFLLIFINKKTFSKVSIAIYLLYLSYLSFQLLNGAFNSQEAEFSFVPFLCLLLAPLIVSIYGNFSRDEQLSIIKGVLFYSIILYLFVDFFSVIFINKSQHVILSNVLPFLTIALLLVIGFDKNCKPFFYFILYAFYVFWIFISIFYFTEDLRIQVKAFSITIFIYFSAVFLWLSSCINSRLKTRKVSRISSSILGVLVIMSAGISSAILYFSPIILEIFDRETSYFLRNAVSLYLIDELVSGNFFNIIFGYGFGSSFKEVEVFYNGVSFSLKSHSGLVSVVYENGLLFFPFFVVFLFWSFGLSSKAISFREYFLTLILLFTFLILNLVYLVAIFVPNYVHQSQFVLFLLCVMFLKRSSVENESPDRV